MKIKRIDEKPVVVFDDITSGTVFEHNRVIYMKIYKLEKVVNAVRLIDGAGASFIGNDEIIPLDAELVIK